MSPVFIAYLVLAGLGLIQGLLFLTHLIENRRFARGRCRTAEQEQFAGHVQLIVPCKGHDRGLADNLSKLLEQDHIDYEVTFVVESPNDPALAEIRTAMAAHPHVAAQIVVAGLATHCGQKIHNLRAATEQLHPHTRVLAFVDSDARPGRRWLRHLTFRLDRDKVGAITGYRWFIPARNTLSNLLLCNINAAVAGLIGPGGHQFVWGGSWAIRRETFEQTAVREAWRGTLSDDLVVTRVLKQAGLQIHFEPKCLVASSVDSTWGQTLEFVRRQFVIGRFYTHRWWAGAVAVSLLSTAAFWVSAVTAAIWAASGNPRAWIPAAITMVLWGTHAWRGWLRQDIPRICLPEFKSQLTVSRWLDVLAAPVVGLVSLACLLTSMVGHRITWRGIGYTLTPGGRIAGIVRQDADGNNRMIADDRTSERRQAA